MNNELEIKINGVAIPTCSDIQIAYEDLDKESGRGVNDGKLVRVRVRTNVVKLSCQWLSITDAQIRQLTNAATPVTFSLEYYDRLQGKRITKTCYAGPKTMNVQRVANGIRLSDVSINFIEV